jgi:exopolysaccharide production repressor protein
MVPSTMSPSVPVPVESAGHVRYVNNCLRGKGGFFHDVRKSRRSLEGVLMFAPRVFVSMLGALAVFAIVTFLLTGSAWTTAWQTLACAVLLQAGYFVTVLALVIKEGKNRRKMTQGQSAASAAAGEEKEPKALHVPHNPPHFNS